MATKQKKKDNPPVESDEESNEEDIDEELYEDDDEEDIDDEDEGDQDDGDNSDDDVDGNYGSDDGENVSDDEKEDVDKEDDEKEEGNESDGELYTDIIFDENIEEQKMIERDQKITKPYMTKFEFVKILAIRTNLLARGAKPMFKNTNNLTSREIAILELKNKTIPLYLSRRLPNSKPEIWFIDELVIFDKFYIR